MRPTMARRAVAAKGVILFDIGGNTGSLPLPQFFAQFLSIKFEDIAV